MTDGKNTPPSDLLDVAGALDALQSLTGLRLSRRTVNRWAADGTIPTHSTGRRGARLMTRTAVEAHAARLKAERLAGGAA